MEHYQIAKKNATVGDIKRRFMNNGICIPYNIYAINREGNIKLIWNMLHSLKQIIRWTYKKAKSFIRGNKKSEYYAIFKRAFYYAQIRYTLKIFFNKEFRNVLTKEDWVVETKDKKVLA